MSSGPSETGGFVLGSAIVAFVEIKLPEALVSAAD
jgi:hypothetical protein